MWSQIKKSVTAFYSEEFVLNGVLKTAGEKTENIPSEAEKKCEYTPRHSAFENEDGRGILVKYGCVYRFDENGKPVKCGRYNGWCRNYYSKRRFNHEKQYH